MVSHVATRDRLIRSTQHLLWERGYVGTSPRAILERSGVGQGSLYHHFRGKADLAATAMQRSAEELQAAAEHHLGGAGTAFERIERWLQREREVLRGCPIGRLSQDPDVVADPGLRRPVEQTMQWLHQRLSQVLAEGQQRGELATDLDPSEVAEAIIAVLQGGYVLARAADSAEPFHRATRGVLALLGGHTRSAPTG